MALDSPIQVSKLDAARRQLETAVRLYFAEADPVSIHTLTAAAYEILRNLNRHKRGKPMLKDSVLTWVVPEFQKRIRSKLNEAQTFFKHAKDDPTRVLDFYPRQTEILLCDACAKYRELSSEVVPAFMVLQMWFFLDPNCKFIVDPSDKQIDTFRRMFSKSTRATFYAEALPIFSRLPSPVNRPASSIRSRQS